MDPLSITGKSSSTAIFHVLITDTTSASVIAVLQITGAVISICLDYQIGNRNASKDMLTMTHQLTSLRDVLEHLLELSHTESAQGLHRLLALEPLIKPDGLLDRCLDEMTTLKTRLQPESGWKSKRKALMWPLKESDFKKSMKYLDRIKNTLTLALTTDQV
jgi:ankyrin repeat domain-containing protein 50